MKILSLVVMMVLLVSCGGADKSKDKEAAKGAKGDQSQVKKEEVKKVSAPKKKKSRLGKALIRLPKNYKKGDIIEVKTVVTHPQDTGIGKNAKPAYYVKEIKMIYGEKTLAILNTLPAISKDPYFSFKLKVDKSAPLKVVWEDNKGGVFEKQVDIKVGG